STILEDLVKKKYPLAPLTISMMLEKKLNIDYESEMAYQLLKLIIKQLKKSAQISQVPERYGFYVMPRNMDAIHEVQSCWSLVDLPHKDKTFGNKWLFKMKTEIDGNVHTYKARLVAKVYTHTYGLDCEEKFSPIIDIRAIRIFIAVPAFYEYDIWQIDVKTAFFNGHLNEDIYMVQPKGFKMETSKRGHIPMQENPNLSKNQGPSKPEENILNNLRNTKDTFIFYGDDNESELMVTCYTDVGVETYRDDTRSQT
ncbi:retrotransposon protein, putative, ty1-copia subclass, partial [Tanacetum coccineum]